MAVVNLNAEPSKELTIVDRWIKRIKREQKIHEDYRDDATDAYDIFLADCDNFEVYYPLLWSVVSVQSAAVYSDTPVPDVRCRGSQDNPAYKEAATVVQRALEVTVDNTQFDDNMRKSTQDMLVAGLGLPRVKVDSVIVEEDPEGNELDVPQIPEQEVRIEHVPWSRFGWEPCSNWVHVNWIYFEHHLYPAEVKKRWPDAQIGANEEENVNRDKSRRSRTKNEKARVVIYEVWNKKTLEVLIIAEGSTEPLEVISDPLQLEQFFPIPIPMMTTVASDDLIPTPDYTMIKSFDKELQRLYKRRRALTEQIKAASLHDASLIEIEDMEEVSDGDSVPVSNLEARMDGGDLRKSILFWPLDERVNALRTVTEQIQLIRQHVDDLLGIADVIRGGSNPQDGQDTNKIKERWAGIRLRPKQIMVQEQVRDLFALMAEVLVEHVTKENLERMTQMAISDEAYRVLRDDKLRELVVDVETDSTVARDEFAERRERGELLQALNQYVQVVAPAVMQNVVPADLAKEMLKIAVDPYKKYSRDMDDVIEKLPDQMQQQQQAQQQAQQAQQQIQQLTDQLKQKDYALAQFSQTEEARKDREVAVKEGELGRKVQETEVKGFKEAAETEHTQAQTQTELMEPAKVAADTELSEAKAVDTLRPDAVPGV